MFLDRYAQHLVTPLLMNQDYDEDDDDYADEELSSLFPMTNLGNAQKSFTPRSRKASLAFPSPRRDSMASAKLKANLTRQHTVSFPLQLLELNRMGIDFNQLKNKRLSIASDILPSSSSRRPSLSSSLLQKFPQLAEQDVYQGILSRQQSLSGPSGRNSKLKRLSIASSTGGMPEIKPTGPTVRPLGIMRTKSFNTNAPEGMSASLPTRSHSLDVGRQHLLPSSLSNTTYRNTRLNAERSQHADDVQNGLTLAERIEKFKSAFMSEREEKIHEQKLRAARRFKRLRSVVHVVFRKPDGQPLTPVDEEESDEESDEDTEHVNLKEYVKPVRYYDPAWASLQNCRYLRMPSKSKGE